MRSELELLAEGVVFSRREDGRIRAKGKPGIDLLSEVGDRIPLVKRRRDGGPSQDGDHRWGQCDVCGLAMRDYAGGNCFLCQCAAQKVLDEIQQRHGPVAPANVISGYESVYEELDRRAASGSMNDPGVCRKAPWEVL